MFKKLFGAVTGGRYGGRLPILPGALMQEQIAFQFGIYYLPVPVGDPIAALHALLRDRFMRFRRVDAIELVEKEMSVAPQMMADVKTHYTPPDTSFLQHFGRGLTRAQALALQDSQQALVLDFGYSKYYVSDGLRAAIELTGALARETGGLVWDDETNEVFTPDAWEEQRLDAWTEGVPNILRHKVVHAYNKGKHVRAITLGMIKFGLPDIVVDGFSRARSQDMGYLINLFAQAIAEGAIIERAGEFDLDLNAIKHPKVRDSQVESLKSNAAAVALLSLYEGTWERGDPNNRLVEIAFDRYPGVDIYAQQEKMLSSFFGWEDSLKLVKYDEELLAASQQAKEKLPSLRVAFNAGLTPSEFIQVKAPFATPDGGNEWMWVEVISWEGERITGLLRNKPFNIPDLHAGQIVEVSEGTVFDYIRKFSDGTQEGNETSKIIERP